MWFCFHKWVSGLNYASWDFLNVFFLGRARRASPCWKLKCFTGSWSRLSDHWDCAMSSSPPFQNTHNILHIVRWGSFCPQVSWSPPHPPSSKALLPSHYIFSSSSSHWQCCPSHPSSLPCRWGYHPRRRQSGPRPRPRTSPWLTHCCCLQVLQLQLDLRSFYYHHFSSQRPLQNWRWQLHFYEVR